MKKASLWGLLSLLFLLNANGYAQQTRFSGTWNFKEQESISGNLYANGSPSKVTISMNASDQKMDYLTSDGQNDVPSSERFIGNKPFEPKTKSGRRKVVVLTWSADKTSFTETCSIYSLTDAAKLEFKNTDVWALTNGELILDRKNENYTNGETWESKATYERQ